MHPDSVFCWPLAESASPSSDAGFVKLLTVCYDCCRQAACALTGWIDAQSSAWAPSFAQPKGLRLSEGPP